MRRATHHPGTDDRARELVRLHVGARAIPCELREQIEWAVAERLHDELEPALDASLLRLLDAEGEFPRALSPREGDMGVRIRSSSQCRN